MLQRQEVRRSKETLDELLHDQFAEIGSSGKLYTKKEMIELLRNDVRNKFVAVDYELSLLSPAVAKLNYKEIRESESGACSQIIRTSIWKCEKMQWKLWFHQGTCVRNSVGS